MVKYFVISKVSARRTPFQCKRIISPGHIHFTPGSGGGRSSAMAVMVVGIRIITEVLRDNNLIVCQRGIIGSAGVKALRVGITGIIKHGIGNINTGIQDPDFHPLAHIIRSQAQCLAQHVHSGNTIRHIQIQVIADFVLGNRYNIRLRQEFTGICFIN